MTAALKRLYSWMGNCVYSPYADATLGILFFLESIFFLPTDPMLIVYCFERRNKAYWYATIATVASVLGGMTGYYLGYLLWEYFGQQILHNKLVNYVLSPELFNYLCTQYQQHECFAILMAAFTPIPYKAATLSAGFCKLSFIPFVICSVIGRGARFFLYAIIISTWGARMKVYIERYFGPLMVLAMVLIFVTVKLVR
jgi:membrane protein YqaA with SNARE-associated domain